MRIAILQTGMPLQSYTRDLVNGLGGQGFDVDLLIGKSSDKGLIDAKGMETNVEFLWEGGTIGRILNRLRCRLAQLFHVPGSVVNPLSRLCLDWIFFVKKRRYDLLIGIDKAGLSLASQWSRKDGTPVVYYSLELYLEDHPSAHRFRWQRREEILNHHATVGTLIQDKFRWSILMKANGISSDHNAFFMPIGVRGGLRLNRTNYVQNTYNIPLDAFVLLYIGNITTHRHADLLLKWARHLPEDMYLLLHGPADGTVQAQGNYLPHNVILSTALIPEGRVRDLLTSCHLGLALYGTDSDNDRLTAFSSQKIALYFQACLPIVAFRSPSYEELARACCCVELINSFEDLLPAVLSIRNNYEKYVDGAKEAYSRYYELDRYFPALGDYLRNLHADHLAGVTKSHPTNNPLCKPR